MLVTMAEMLQEAQKKNYAVPAPNVWNEESTRAALMAAENCKSPVILDMAIYRFMEENRWCTNIWNIVNVGVSVRLFPLR